MKKIHLKDDVIVYKNFMSKEECNKLIDYFETAADNWDQTCFYDSLGMSLVADPRILQTSGLLDIHPQYFDYLRQKTKEAVEEAFDQKVRVNTQHAQKWPTGSFARWHSDNSDLDGKPSAWRINKYASILYLNENYSGGELEFRDHDLKIKLETGSLIAFPGGASNVHRVNEITDGTRFTVVSFWDYEDAYYSPEELEDIEEEIARERVKQAEQKQQWASGNTNA